MSKHTDAELEVLCHHYSETFELLKTDVAKRDRLFLYILILIFTLLLYMSAPTVMSDWLNGFVSSQAGAGNGDQSQLIDVSFMGVILLLGLLSLSHTYFQTVLHVQRQYDYVYKLEERLSQQFDELAFTREGRHYEIYKRKFASWTKFIFWYLFPILFAAFNIFWLIFLFTRSGAAPIYLVVDSLISVTLLISLGLYLWALLKEK